jgi:hypothetical protein
MILRSPPLNGGAVTLTSNITAGAATLTYTGSDVIAVGDLIVIDNEIMGAGVVNTSTNSVPLFRGRLGTTAAAHTAGVVIRTLTSLSVREMVSTAEETASGTDIIAAWAPAGTLNQAAHAANAMMINAFRNETVTRLTNRDIQDEVTSLGSAEATAKATYNARYQEQV